MKFKGIIFTSIVITLLFCSCKKTNRFAINTSKDRIKVVIQRFDKDLILLDTINTEVGVKQLYQKYPDFFPFYISSILERDPQDTLKICDLIKNFLKDTTFVKVNKKVLEEYADVSDIETTLSTAFTYTHYYFPEIKLPTVYFFVSGFNRAILWNDHLIGIGTDLYLGNDYPLYKEITYEYMIYNMRRECIPADIVSTLLVNSFPMKSSQDRLIENMLYRGKIMYLLSIFLPEEKPTDLIGYTPTQWEWCKKHEKEIWASVIEQKALFSSDSKIIGAFINDAPFTAPISQDSPGRLGTWIGWQIIKSYMETNKNVDLRQLMNERNYEKLLENSNYYP
ncbi:MAG TPA: hypothetical protein PK296_03225 [Paludibacteraceae bacterium]|nr:hypothetical protein [Paludibacteraceae bacterium]